MPVKRRSLFIYLFALSGFTGLIYESIWTHYLKLFLGHAAYAQALVLAIFMGGIALGSWISGRYSGRWKNLILGYAITEAVIGFFALAFHNGFDKAIQFSYASVIPNLGPAFVIVAYKWTLAALMILPQTVLLGMTFPLMTAGILRMYPDDSGSSISLLYFTNSLGAALGVLTSGFLLIGLVGLPGTIRLAGIINVGLGITVWLMLRGLPAEAAGTRTTATGNDQTHPDLWYRLLLAASLLTGAASFIYEIGYLRMLSLVLGSSTHAFELMLSAFIFGLACGGLWMRRRIGSLADSIPFLAKVQIIMGFCALFSLALYGKTFDVMQWLMNALPRTDAGYALFNLSSGAIALAIMFPAAFCAGMTLPLLTTTLIRKGHGERSIGAVYATNTVGAIIGVFFAIHVGMPWLGLKGLMMTGAGLDVALGIALLWSTRSLPGSHRVRAGVTVACIGVVVLTSVFVELDPFKMASGVYRYGMLTQRESEQLVYYKDGKTSTVSAFLNNGVLDIRTNGKPDASIQLEPGKSRTPDEPTMILLAAIPLSIYPRARTAANIGFGSGFTTATFLQSESLAEVDTIEIEPAMVEGAKNFGPLVAAAYTDRRSKIYIDDAKTFFSAQHKKYDIIVSEPSNPWVSGVAGLFSEEFYRLIGYHLTEDGVFCQWLHLYEMDVNLVVSVLKALSSSFSNIVIYASTDYDIIIIAKNGRPVADPDSGVFHNANIAASLNQVQIHSADDLALRKIGDKAFLKDFLESFPIQANSDFYPVLDLNATRSRFLHMNSDEFILMTYRPLPLSEMLMGPPLAAGRTTITPAPASLKANACFIAMALRDIVMADSARERYAAVPPEVLDQAVQLKRLFFTDCRASSDERLARLYDTMALQMTPFLRPNELAGIWKRLETGACMGSFSRKDRQWLALFKAVGQRDARVMTSAATVLLAEEQGMPGGPLSYVVASGMTGYLMQGDRERSLGLWREYRARLYGTSQPSLFFRLLAAQSTKS